VFCRPRAFGLGFLQTPPHDDALALLLAFGSANTRCEDFHLAGAVPCRAHTTTSAAPNHVAKEPEEDANGFSPRGWESAGCTVRQRLTVESIDLFTCHTDLLLLH